MVTSRTPLDLDDPGLFRTYDQRSVERGIRYADEGRVEVVEVGPGWATGEVQGTDVEPYLVDVEWLDQARGVSIVDECSCPLGGDCKHAVALIVTLARINLGIEPPRHAAAPSGSPVTRPGYGVTLPAAAAAPPRTDWRQALAKVAADTGSGAAPLALQFFLVAPKATYYNPHPPLRVEVRPMRMGAKGKWVKTGASWRDVESPYLHFDLRNADASQLVTLRAMAQSTGAGLYAVGGNSVPLDRFGGGMWTSLRNATDAGVELIGAGGVHSVTLSSDPAELVVDLTATDDGGITLRTGFRYQGAVVAPSQDRVLVVGSPPHGLCFVDGGDVTLVPLSEQVHDGVAQLLAAGTLSVPAADVDEFLDGYQPQLARAAKVVSSDGSVTDHQLELVGLVALVDHHRADAARLTWAARYRRGLRETTYRLADRAGAVRDRAAERQLLSALELPTDLMAGLRDSVGRPVDLSVRGAAAVTLLTEVLPWLTEHGQAIVEVSGEAPELRQAVGDPLVNLDVREPDGEDGSDWFDLSVEVSIDGEDIEFAELFTALAMGEAVLVLPSGTWLDLDRPELAQLRALIGEARGLQDAAALGTVRINRFQTSWWDELTGLGVVRSQSERWERNVARMRGLTAPRHVEPHPELAATLRPYQQQGLDWLAFLHDNQLGGILADDMGLGKTVQSLALFLHVLDQQPDARFLVVAPTSVVANWQRETNRFAPGVEVRAITGTEARRGTGLVDAVGDARVVVTSYALFRIELEEYQKLEWEILVLDEAQFVKNHRAKTYQCVRRLDATIKLAVTGTPIENSLMDLWSLLSIVAPGLYPDPKRFSEVYRRPIEAGRAPELLDTLRRRVAPLMRRRTKDDVLTELPPKTEQTVDIELSPRHQRIYQTQLQRQRSKVLGLVDDVHRNRFEILRSLTLLRQLSLDPALIDEGDEGVGSAKLDRLVEDLTEIIAEGHRALVFSTFTRFLGRAKERLDDAGIAYAYLDGRTRRREDAIARFKEGEAPVFLISLKAGGFGLNLTEADYCFVLDPWWNPAAETQAVDRAHRIGQERPVIVYRYVATGTIEEKVMELKARKAALFSSVVDADDKLAGALDESDIRALIDLPG